MSHEIEYTRDIVPEILQKIQLQLGRIEIAQKEHFSLTKDLALRQTLVEVRISSFQTALDKLTLLDA
ncbi:MAG: hypothetical protein SGJ17_00170 [Hyphomicrobiales bacterium]|nr:hypothetical protein [Hyphomicrobiales bacterium]